MPAKNHPAYKEEKERLKYTLRYVEKNLDTSYSEKIRIDNELAKGKRHFDSSDSQSYIGLMVNTMIQDRINLKLKNLEKAKARPYFARIDFKEYGKFVPEKLYIGKMVLIKDEDQELIIVDWRAPIANLYYESRIGNTSYLCPDGSIEGELTIKRQFSIDEGILNDIFDIDITTNDEFLQSYLGANADNRLKDIVSTIQVEQNQIIRSDMWKPLIVQGAAGSGKTTIALHRIAYLIYTYEKRFNPENFMIIAPNRLFLNYISSVLPELGVEKVKQTTFQDFALELIGQKFKIRDGNEKLISFVNHNNSSDEIMKNELIRREAEFKSSIVFKEILDEYINIIKKSYIPVQDFSIASTKVLSYEEINNLFMNEYKNLPFMKRVMEIKKHLINALKRRKDGIQRNLQEKCDATIEMIKITMEDSDERHKLIVDEIDSKNDLTSKIESISKKAVKEYIDRISKVNAFNYYKDLVMNNELFHSLLLGRIDEEFIEPIRQYSIKILESGYIEIEDLAPIIYIKYCIYGMDEKIPVKHIVIDEAQDFSVFQYYVIKKIVKDSSFTILGDLCQGIHSYRGTKNWNDVMKYAFEDSEAHLLQLEQSYRTTVEIMEAANKVICHIKGQNLPLAKPVIRHGDKVLEIEMKSLNEIAVDISKKISKLKGEGYKSIAVICKTMDECIEISSYLKEGDNIPYIITGNEKEYKGGIVIVPSYLAKGLEFDAVMISDASSLKYNDNELDAKLLYVAMTRSLHKLFIYYCKVKSQLLIELI